MLSPALLEILCCPGCHGDLLYEPEKFILTCRGCGRVFQVKNDIPIMLLEEQEAPPSGTAAPTEPPAS